MSDDQLLEISDLIVDFDPLSLTRRPVRREAVVDRLRQVGQSRGASIVQRLPTTDGILDSGSVDQLLIRAHCEMQRLSEEFQHGRRVLELLVPLLKTLELRGVEQPFRIVDIGCGTGYVMRWLAAHRNEFAHSVELVGVDFNAALIEQARRLAKAESLDCEFLVANAFSLQPPATVYISTGVLHHFRGDHLREFFVQHDQLSTEAFFHFDFQPTILSHPGAWLFHFIRMREPLSCHDGVVSARRAHKASRLTEAARHTSFRCGMYSCHLTPLRLPRVFQTIIGVRPGDEEAFRRQLGPRVSRLEQLK